jgi:uncharacterized protein (UPF0548 family)
MPRRPSRFRRLTTAARWPVGVSLTSWRYLWRTTPLYRSEEEGAWEADAAPPLPSGVSRDEIQWPEQGAGALFHRRYAVVIRDARLSPEELMERLAGDPDRAAPTEFATFNKVCGETGEMRVGDEFVVRMPGPWDGPVRVVERTPDRFRLATLDGHLEAGQIQFSAAQDGGRLVFRIESWARSADRLSDLLYDRLRMSKEIQFHMWTSFLERVVDLAGGTRDGGLRIHTRRVAEPSALQALHDRPLNFDPEGESFTSAVDWKVDDYSQPLPPEPPGAPLRGGTWERARELMREYAFADPRIVRAVHAPDSALKGRDILLELRFLGLRLPVGVRVARVMDETSEVDGREVRVWGWTYRTLQGHLEVGQMDYEVRKWADDGSVEFRIHVVSRPARIPNPIVRLGFRLFGRREQIRFAKRACERMAALVGREQGI